MMKKISLPSSIGILFSLLLAFVVCPLFAQAGTVYLPNNAMWDTWLLQEGDDYHLFWLSGGGIGRAVSKDLIHWKSLPRIPNLAKKGDWDEAGMKMTGSTVKHNGKFYLCYGSGEGTPIGLIESDDLVNWKRVGNKPVLPVKEPYSPGPWRDLVSYWNPEKKEWDGYLYGRHKATYKPCIVHVTSKDYLNWDYHEPLFISEEYTRDNKGFVNLEVPDVFEFKGKHYVVFAGIRSRKNFTSGRSDASGTWFLMADKKEGPYRVTENPLLLGTGMGRYDHYVGHTIMYKGKRLLYHQNWGQRGVANQVNWSTPKLLAQQPNGELILKYWSDLDTLKEKLLLKKKLITLKPTDGKKFAEQPIDVAAKDFMLTCDVDATAATSATLCWRLPSKEELGRKKTYGLKMEPKKGIYSIVDLKKETKFYANTYHLYLRDQYTNTDLAKEKLQLRLMVRSTRCEVYVNDRWIFNVGMHDISLNPSKLLLVAEGGEVKLENLEIHELEELNKE